MRRTKSTWDVRPRIYHRAAVVASASRRAAAAFELAEVAVAGTVPFPCDDVDDGYPFPEDAFDMVVGDGQFRDDVFGPVGGVGEEDDGFDLRSPIEERVPRRSLEMQLPSSGRPFCVPDEYDDDGDDDDMLPLAARPVRAGTSSSSALLRAAVRRRLPSISFLRRTPSDADVLPEDELPRFAHNAPPPVSPPRTSVRGMLASLSGRPHSG